jgi:CubicO group peptidase (beta-lactamase class C family)
MQHSKRHPALVTIAVTLAVIAGAVFHPALGAGQSRVQRKLEAELDDLFESEPAWGGALVAKDGEVLFQKSYGWSNYDQAKPNGPNTVFRIQSLSKTFTAVATLMLVEDGRLSLDDRVVDLVPELVEGDGVTIRHLLQNESGIFNYSENPVVWENFDRVHTPEELLEYFVDRPLSFEPGTRFEYSNSNFVLLGLIIQRVTGKPYGKFLHKRVFKPLHMRRSRFDPHDLAFVNRRAVGYGDILADPPTVDPYIPPSIAYAAGGIMSTAGNLLKYDQALYGERLLSQESLEEAFSPDAGPYGLGWFIHHERIRGRQHKLVWHSGGGPGFRSLLLRLVDARVTLVLLFNTTGYEQVGDEEIDYEDLFRIVRRLARRFGRIVLRGSG